MTENFEQETDDKDGILQLINNSSEIAGSTIAGLAAGVLSGDLITSAVLGAGGKAFEIGLRMIGNEILERMTGPREKIRAGAAIAFAVVGISKRLERGENHREDGFFDKSDTGRSSSDEMLENIILKTQREPEEKKIPYISSIYENTAFEAEISADLSHKIIKSAEQLTYQHLCILSMVGSQKDQDEIFRDSQPILNPSLEQSILLHDCFELSTMGYIQGGLVLTFSGQPPRYEDLRPQSMRLEKIGTAVHKLMNLQDIPENAIAPIAKLLRWEKKILPQSGETMWNPKI